MPNAETNQKPLRAEAYDRIVSLLNTQQIRPGQLVSQRELVDRIGSTLGAVREAIPRLEAEGQIKTLRQRGLMVPTIDVTFVRNACQLRNIIELEAIANAHRSIPLSTIEAWEQEHADILARLEQGTTQELAREAQEIDWAMHDGLIKSLSNELISDVYRVNAIKVRMAAHEQLLVTPFNAVRVMHEHLAILKALKAQQWEEAATAMRKHLANSLALALGGEII
ncbi:MAG: GntR family transcriptional regulator [Rhizobiales bacterium]|nr:GntR family transcriptional regulator [Hyphomicrobiales bacterium]